MIKNTHTWASLVAQTVEKPHTVQNPILGSIPGLGKSPREGKGYPLQYSGLKNSMDWGAWQATVQWHTVQWHTVLWLVF